MLNSSVKCKVQRKKGTKLRMEKINTDCFQDFVRDQYLLSISILNQHTIF